MFAPFFTHSQQMMDRWTSAAREGLERMDGWAEDWTRAHTDAVTRTEAAIDEGAKLCKENLGRAAELPAEWRKVWIDAAKELLARGNKPS